MKNNRLSHRIAFDEDDMLFIKEYKKAFGDSIQKFVTEAVKDKIDNIKLSEKIENLKYIK